MYNLIFHPVELGQRALFLPYLTKRTLTSDRSFTNLYCWQHFYDTCWTEWNGWLVIRAHITGRNKTSYLPLSKEETPDYREIVPLLKEIATLNNEPLSLMGLAPSECNLIQEQLPDAFVFVKNRDFADYIYRAEDLRTLKGRKYAQKRNHVNKFKSLYNYHFEPITNNNIQDCLNLEKHWVTHHQDNESAQAEYETILKAFRDFGELQLIGGLLYVDNRIVAFTYGSAVNPETFCTHVEKADIRYEGVYQMINYLFANHLPEQYAFINREEDMGIPGLRKSKMSYEPIRLAYKTTATEKNVEGGVLSQNTIPPCSSQHP